MAGFGKFDGKNVDGVEVKVSGGAKYDEVLHDGESLYLVVAVEVDAIKFNTTEKKGLVREQFVKVSGAIRMPYHMVADVEKELRLASGEPNFDDALEEAAGLAE